jgi:murein DD-endopeptidase MepM/ murein hydrolase activator NlpD
MTRRAAVLRHCSWCWGFAAIALAGLPGLAQSTLPRIEVAVEARAIQPGELVVLTITTPAPAPSLIVRAFGRDLTPFAVDARTWRVLLGIDLDVAPGAHRVAIETPADRATHTLTVTSRVFRTRTLKVDEAFVNPPASVQARIAAEAAEQARIWAAPAESRLWSGAFVKPVPQEANSAFGSRSIFNGQARSPHSGADFASPAGTPIKAPNGGRIVLAKDLYYTGGTVIIDHGLGLFSVFAHLSAVSVKPGEMVTTGAIVGRVGATGRVTGAHLHWTVRASGARVDPMALLAVLGG